MISELRLNRLACQLTNLHFKNCLVKFRHHLSASEITKVSSCVFRWAGGVFLCGILKALFAGGNFLINCLCLFLAVNENVTCINRFTGFELGFIALVIFLYLSLGHVYRGKKLLSCIAYKKVILKSCKLLSESCLSLNKISLRIKQKKLVADYLIKNRASALWRVIRLSPLSESCDEFVNLSFGYCDTANRS